MTEIVFYARMIWFVVPNPWKRRIIAAELLGLFVLAVVLLWNL